MFINCIAVNRQRGRFAGFSLYVSNSDVLSEADIKDSTLCYKDSPPLPAINFTAMGLKQGRYVIYYNERLEGAIYPTEYEVNNVYTELCEVKVQGICLNLLKTREKSIWIFLHDFQIYIDVYYPPTSFSCRQDFS